MFSYTYQFSRNIDKWTLFMRGFSSVVTQSKHYITLWRVVLHLLNISIALLYHLLFSLQLLLTFMLFFFFLSQVVSLAIFGYSIMWPRS